MNLPLANPRSASRTTSTDKMRWSGFDSHLHVFRVRQSALENMEIGILVEPIQLNLYVSKLVQTQEISLNSSCT